VLNRDVSSAAALCCVSCVCVAWLCVVSLSLSVCRLSLSWPCIYSAVVTASTLQSCLTLDGVGLAHGKAMVEQYIAAVEAANGKMKEVRCVLTH
jgi:hypothetical protein